MYRTFADSEFFCRLPYSGVAFYDIIGDFYGAFFNVIFQENPPANIVFTMYAEDFGCMSIFCFCSMFIAEPYFTVFEEKRYPIAANFAVVKSGTKVRALAYSRQKEGK